MIPSTAPTPHHPSPRAFTLVELLVVIAIISILTALLLPALTTAHRQAQRVKCLAHMRAMYFACEAYAGNHNGYWPVVHASKYGGKPPEVFIVWYNFLAPYLDPAQTQSRSNRDLRLLNGRVTWGCPEWGVQEADDYFIGEACGHENGYGMNMLPGVLPTSTSESSGHLHFRPNVPDGVRATWSGQDPTQSTGFFKQAFWQKYRPAERMLMADSAHPVILSFRVTTGPRLIPPIRAQHGHHDNPWGAFRDALSTTTVDLYRHGIRPPLQPNGIYYDPYKGRVGYNILYCDGHAEHHTHGREAFRSVRMRFPG